MAVRILTLNTGGLLNEIKRRKIFHEYRNRCDILCLQETHCTENIEHLWKSEWGGLSFYANGTSSARGVAILINPKFYCNITKHYSDSSGRFLVLDLEKDSLKLSIACIYAPNTDSPGFFHEVMAKISSFHAQKIIIGDYNLVLNTKLDRLDSDYNNVNAKNVILDIMSENYLCEIWRDRNPDQKRYSWFRPNRNKLQASRIDFALVSQGLCSRTNECFYIKGISSDHSAFFISIKTSDCEKGSGYWKLNTSILKEKEYLKRMSEKLSITCQEESESAVERWEKIKKVIRKTTQDYCKGRTSENKLIISELMEKITEMEDNFSSLNEKDMEILSNSKVDLEEKLDEQTRSRIFRSKATWICESDRNTKYFCNLERARAEARVCHTLIDENGKEIDQPKEVLAMQQEFYANLYKRNSEVKFKLDCEPKSCVIDGDAAKTESPFSSQEISNAVLQLNNNKTPGPDGIGIDFYKVFWKFLKDPLCNAINEVYLSENMIPSSSKGIINLIPKKERDSRLLKNLRPITLLNSDYKVVEKAIAGRMVPAMESLIHTDQKGFLPNRKIVVNIRKAFDILRTVQKKDKQHKEIYVTCDFQKAFDKISTESILKTLEYFQFSEYIINWTRILYTGFTAKIQNNGNFSDEINIEQSVHQGAPNSCYYFILVVEILADALRNNNSIYGIKVGDIHYMLSQFADDMDSALDNESCIKPFFDTLEWFKTISGLTLNYDKTTIYRASIDDSKAQNYSVKQEKWSSGDLNVLGIQICENDAETINSNYVKTLNSMKATLEAWSRRNLSLEGKVVIINTMISSLFVYKMMTLPRIPDALIKKINRILEDFLWGKGKRPKISTTILQRKKEDGGLKLFDVSSKEKALKATWIPIVFSDKEIANLAHTRIQKSLGYDIWSCNLHPNDVKKVIREEENSFWPDVLEAWANYRFNKSLAGNQLLWWNSHIKANDRPILITSALDKGLKYVDQLYTEQKFISQQEASQKYGLTIMQFNMIKSAIKKTVKDSYLEVETDRVYPILTANNVSRMVYDNIKKTNQILDPPIIKWSNMLDGPMDEKEWRTIFIEARKITTIGKLRSFQYRLLRGAIITNVQLKRWNKREDDTCSLCHAEIETIVHLLYDCVKVKVLWREVEKMCYKLCQEPDIVMSKTAIILNRITCKKKYNVCNFMCLACKQYIYRQRCLGKDVSAVDLNRYIKTFENSEQYYAKKSNKMKFHTAKWMPDVKNESASIDFNISEFIDSYVDTM